MIKNYFLFVFLLLFCQVFSQEIYLNTGKNFTQYGYKNSLMQSDPNLHSGTGNFYEIGIAKPFTNEHLLYSVGLSLNDFNAVGSTTANSYRWDTQYLGVCGKLNYSFFPRNNGLNFLLDLGFNGSTIIYGKQEIDGAYYDLVHQKEFAGLWLGTSIGIQTKYKIESFGFLSLGYDFCQNISVSNTTKEKLSFSTQQIQLGFHFPIN